MAAPPRRSRQPLPTILDGEGAAAAPSPSAEFAPLLPAGRVRNVDASRLFEQFLVAAAASFLGIRIYLALTGYPQIGGHGLHIAHMLWGGLLLVVALGMALSFLGRPVRFAASIVGGIGFGAFIDELGKFITSDNDYFYRPTIALIYAIFVLIYVAFQAVVERNPASPAAALPQAVDVIETGVLRGFAPADRRQALDLLDRSDPRHPFVAPLRHAVAATAIRLDPPPGRFQRAFATGQVAYRWLVEQRRFLTLVMLLAVIQAVGGVASVVSEIAAEPSFLGPTRSVSFAGGLKAAAQGLAMLLIAVGAVRWTRSRLAGYRWFKRGVLVSLLLVQTLSFYTNELAAAGGLAFNLLLLGALNFAIDREADLVAAPGIAEWTDRRRAPSGHGAGRDASLHSE